MLASSWWEIPTGWALATVAGVLAVAVALSLAFPAKEKNAE
jgi:hypothetical protein